MEQLIERVNKLATPVKAGIIFGIIVLLTGGNYFFFIADLTTSIEGIKASQASQDGVLAQKQEIADNLNERRKEMDALEQRFQVGEGIVRVGNRRGLFTDLRLRGDQVSFGLRITIDPGVLVTHEFRGTVKGDAIEGTVRVTPDGGKAVDLPWRAVRTSGTTYFQPTGLAVK